MDDPQHRKCEPYDTACHLARMRDWHADFDSKIESLIDYLRELGRRSREAHGECSGYYSNIVELSRAKTRFSFEVSHELKSPLAAVHNVLEILIRGYLKDDPAKRLELLRRARDRVREATTLLDDLLTLSRLEEKTARVKRVPVDIAALLGPLAEEMAGPARERDVAFTWRIGGDLPVVSASPVLLKRAFANIIDNALQYNRPGGNAELAVSRDGDAVLVRLADTGLGIDEDELPLVFDLFFRGRRARAQGRREGIGLGLSLVKRIVEDHGGTIAVTGRAGGGTTVTIRLPGQHEGGLDGEENPDS